MPPSQPPAAVRTLAILAAVILVSGVPRSRAWAQGRTRMLDTSAEIGAADCLKNAAQAVCDEDLDAFVACFTSGQRPELRRRAALLFVSHTLALELIDSHVVSQSADKTELAVKYRVRLTDEAYDIVSIIDLVREDGTWRIAREKVASRTSGDRDGSCGDQAFRIGGGCANGRCGL